MNGELERTVWITRHGSRLDFVDPEWFRTAPRPCDPPLSPAGVKQARELGQRLLGERIAMIVSSPFLRSVETAHEVACILGLALNIEPGLGEWLNPEWFPGTVELLPVETLAERFPRVDPRYMPRGAARFPESGEEALERAARAARRLAAESAGNVLLVGHGVSVLGATAGVLGEPAAQTADRLKTLHYCCLVKLRQGMAEDWTLEINGTVDHLSDTEDWVRFA